MNTMQTNVKPVKHFVSLDTLSLEEIMSMIEESLRYKQGDLPHCLMGKRSQTCSLKTRRVRKIRFKWPSAT